ncbi:MAG: hypothetical protein HY280_09570 [Nitrospinae bacterium]|nr:hypothetical protein [Nitrospinota bacterium]
MFKSQCKLFSSIVLILALVAGFFGACGVSSTTNGSGSPGAMIVGGAVQKNLSLAGTVTTFAGGGGFGYADGTGTGATLGNVYGVTTDGTSLYMCGSQDTIRQAVIATGVVTTVAGSGGLQGSTDGAGSAARFNQPIGITSDGTNLYLSDYTNNSIRKIK